MYFSCFVILKLNFIFLSYLKNLFFRFPTIYFSSLIFHEISFCCVNVEISPPPPNKQNNIGTGYFRILNTTFLDLTALEPVTDTKETRKKEEDMTPTPRSFE